MEKILKTFDRARLRSRQFYRNTTKLYSEYGQSCDISDSWNLENQAWLWLLVILETAAICFYAVIIQSVWMIWWSCPSVASVYITNALVERYELLNFVERYELHLTFHFETNLWTNTLRFQ